MYRKWEAQERFNPFSGMSETAISLALADTAVPARYKVRYLMLGVIFSEVEAENPGFYKMPGEMQGKIIEQKVQSYMAEGSAAKPPVFAAK
jgi:hypothetical protein